MIQTKRNQPTKKNKILKIVLKSLLVLGIIAGLAVAGYFTLKACGFTTAEDFMRLRDDLGDSFTFWLVIGAMQILQVIFIPISNQIITVPCALVFNDELWKVWLVSWISIWIATMILYFVGRFGGKKLLKWILSDEEMTDKCTNWLKKGWVFYPLGMLLPLPDDVVTTLAGTAKMNLFFVAGCSFLTRAADTACSVYGWGLLTRYWWGWLILALGIIALAVATVIFWKIQKGKTYAERTNR